MASLPDRPDIAQLRRLARELLRAATAGDPGALAKLRAVSGQCTLSAAQLAVAREHGFTSWHAMRAEVECRRQHLEGLPGGARAGSAEPPEWDDRWSFGGAEGIQLEAGLLLPGVLIAGPEDAILHASMAPPHGTSQEEAHHRLAEPPYRPAFTDVTVADDQGTTYRLGVAGMFGTASMQLRLDPVPARARAWIELRTGTASATRLVPSRRPAVRVRPVARGNDGSWYQARGPRPPAPAHAARGMMSHLDLGVTLPALDGASVRADTLASGGGGWSLYLRVRPGWWRYSADGTRKQELMAVQARDNRGGTYLSRFGGSTGHGAYEDVILKFTPPLDPRASELTLAFGAAAEHVLISASLE